MHSFPGDQISDHFSVQSYSLWGRIKKHPRSEEGVRLEEGCCSKQVRALLCSWIIHRNRLWIIGGHFSLSLFSREMIPLLKSEARRYTQFSLDCFLFFFLFFICSGFCHTLKWNSHGSTCVPYPDPPSHLPLHPLPLGFPSAPGPSACLMHPTWAGDLFHPRYYTCFDAVLLKHPTLAFSHRV